MSESVIYSLTTYSAQFCRCRHRCDLAAASHDPVGSSRLTDCGQGASWSALRRSSPADEPFRGRPSCRSCEAMRCTAVAATRTDVPGHSPEYQAKLSPLSRRKRPCRVKTISDAPATRERKLGVERMLRYCGARLDAIRCATARRPLRSHPRASSSLPRPPRRPARVNAASGACSHPRASAHTVSSGAPAHSVPSRHQKCIVSS